MSTLGQIRTNQRWPSMSALPLQAGLNIEVPIGTHWPQSGGSPVNFLSGRPKLSILKTKHGCPQVGRRYAGQTPSHVAEISKPPCVCSAVETADKGIQQLHTSLHTIRLIT